MKFLYKARTQQGDERSGKIDASDRKAALDILEKYGLFLTSLEESQGISFLRTNLNISFLNRVSQKEVVMFTRQFGVMLRAAIPPVRALKSQVAQTKNPKFREKILQMAEGIETGSSLSQTFALHPDVFDSFFVSIIRSGEATGKVADALGYLASHLEADYNLKQKVKGAMIYPAFIIVVFIGAFFLVTFFIVPKLTQILKDFSGKLPLSTRALMVLSDFVRKGGWVFVFTLVAAIATAPFLAQKHPKTKRLYDKILVSVPLVSKFFKKVFLVQFCENFSVLIKAGLPITQALSITRDIINNDIYKDLLQETADSVSRGERISSVFERQPKLVYPFVLQMITTGEETGQLEDVLGDVVKFYQEEITRTTDNLTTILEPLLILTLGIGIAILAVAIFIPLFKIGMGGSMM